MNAGVCPERQASPQSSMGRYDVIVDKLVYFFTTPTMEAKSGRKYTPLTGIKRYFEKLDEKSDSSE